MTQPTVDRRRTGVDLLVGVLLILEAMFLLGNVVLATALSVLVLGWTPAVRPSPSRPPPRVEPRRDVLPEAAWIPWALLLRPADRTPGKADRLRALIR